MTVIRKTWWAALVLAAFAGCNEPTEPAADTASPPPPPPAATTPAEIAPARPEGETRPAADMPKDTGPAITAPKIEPAKPDAKDDKKDDKKDEASAAAKVGDEELAEIKKLPADEQEAALKQRTCPVSDEALGSMGVPVKVSAEGKTFYLCCKGCNKDLKDDPKAVVAKLNK